jgi:hypothetical protein
MARFVISLFVLLQLCAAYGALVFFSYDGHCYGFSDGKTPCSFWEHADDQNGWLPFMVIFYAPVLGYIGGALWALNFVAWRVLTRKNPFRSW